MAKYGLIGKNIGYSFSKIFFQKKFENEKRKDIYENFDIPSIDRFPEIISKYTDLKGLNVTIPYKEAILPYLDIIDEEAANIGAVNTIQILSDGRLKGYNTDHYGFASALASFLPLQEKSALVLGTGGASKAVIYVLNSLQFDFKVVSRKRSFKAICYEDIDAELINSSRLIVNCTPLGTYPNVDEFPKIPYQFINKNHLLFDLIYNPETTEFLKLGFAKGARISNGIKMLELQAEKSWKIWKSQ